MKFPCSWGGMLIKDIDTLERITGYNKEELVFKLSKNKTIKEIIIGSNANHISNYYPQTVNGILVDSDSLASEILGLSESSIKKHRLNYESLQEIEDKRLEKEKASYKSKLYSYISSQYNKSVDDFLKEYNGNNYQLRTIISWFERGCDYYKVLKLLKRFRYPVNYNGNIYKNDTEVSDSFNLPYTIVQSRRNAGMSFEELISTPYHPYTGSQRRTRNAEKNGYPYISPDGTIAYNDREMAEICNKDLSWVRSKRKYGWTPEEMYLGNIGIPSSDYQQSTQGSSRSILLLNKYWYPSIKECLARVGLSSYTHIVRSLEDIDEGVARAFIAFANKYNKGYITPNLRIDHLLHIHENTAYYCCYIDGEVDYLSAKEILSYRMNYIQFDFNSHIYRNNGVFTNIKYAELFYCIGKGSISRKVKNKDISYEDATRSIIEDKRHSNPLDTNGKIYKNIGIAAKRNKINKQTLHTRVKSESNKAILRSTSTTSFITVDKWLEGKVIGKQDISYKTKKELLASLGIRVSSAYSRISQGDDLEQLINRELKKMNLYWCPFIEENYSSIKELCDITGLSKDRMYAAWKLGKKQNLTFWESLQKYYMNTKELFDKYKEGFTCSFPHGIFYLKDIVINGDQVYYHSITPSNMLRVMTFKDIFEVLIESRC